MVNTLNLYGDICQLFLSKTGKNSMKTVRKKPQNKSLYSKTVACLQESQALGTSRGPGQQPLNQV